MTNGQLVDFLLWALGVTVCVTVSIIISLIIALIKKNKEIKIRKNKLSDSILKDDINGPKEYREPATDKGVIEFANDRNVEEIRIRGINSISPIHAGREKLIENLNKGTKVKVLLLNPASSAFKSRVIDVESKNRNEDVDAHRNRLYSEFNATIYILRDIATQAGEHNKNLFVRLTDEKPEYSTTYIFDSDNINVLEE